MKRLKQDRQDVILHILEQENRVIASELSLRLEVSEDTVRRDLNELDERGRLKRVHSGAVKNPPAVVNFTERIDRNLEEKIRLAKRAVSLIEKNSVILIDGGTTNYELMRQMPKSMRCTVITNSVPLTDLLRDYPNVRLTLLGGYFSGETQVSQGVELLRQLDKFRPDLYFMGIPNWERENGVSTAILEETYTKIKMLDMSSETAALITREKIGTSSPYLICGSDDITHFITDEEEILDFQGKIDYNKVK